MLYQTRADNVQDEAGEIHIVYGIDAFQRVKSIHDVFFNKTTAENFVKRCNDLSLDLCHLDDVVEDLLAQR